MQITPKMKGIMVFVQVVNISLRESSLGESSLGEFRSQGSYKYPHHSSYIFNCIFLFVLFFSVVLETYLC